MTDKLSLEEIEKLLVKYTGITSAVVFQPQNGNSVGVRFRCIDAVSLTAIARCAVLANVSIKLGDPDSRICAEAENSADLPCDIVIPDQRIFEGTDVPTQPQLFGVFLADDLKRKVLISAEERQRLHAGWNTRLKTPERDQ